MFVIAYIHASTEGQRERALPVERRDRMAIRLWVASIRFQLAFHGKQQLDQTGQMQNAYLRSGKGGVGGFLGQYGFISYLWGGTVFP